MVDANGDGRDGGSQFEVRNINGYILREEIGAGGMSRVYRATKEGTDQSFAIKAIRIENMAADFERRLRREPEVQQGIGHDNIVHLIDWFRVRDEFFLVMEHVEGRSLSELLYRESGPMPFDRARGYMRQMLRAVNHLHSLGIIHRDIKPSNVLVRHDDVVKLADFGIAKFTWQQGETKTQKGLGTPEYMSPEQARGTHIDHRTDIYSLGITFFEMLTARKPFARGEETPAAYVEVIQSILSKPLPDPRSFQPSIPAGAVRLLMKATAKDPSERFQSATDFLGALEVAEDADYSAATVALGDVAPGVAIPGAGPDIRPQPDERIIAERYRRGELEPEEDRGGSRVGLWLTIVLLLLAVAGYFGYRYYDQNIRLQAAGQLDSADVRQIVGSIASDYRTYSIDHNAGGLASLFASSGNRYFSMRNAKRTAINAENEKFFANIEATTIYDIAIRRASAVDDSTIDAEWLITYERIKTDGAILRGQTLDKIRIRFLEGEWLITEQTSKWVKRRNEPPPEPEEPEVIDIPTPVDTLPVDDGDIDVDVDDGGGIGNTNPPLFPPPPPDTAGRGSGSGLPRQNGRPSDVGTPPINPNGGSPASPRRFPSGPVDRPPSNQGNANDRGR